MTLRAAARHLPAPVKTPLRKKLSPWITPRTDRRLSEGNRDGFRILPGLFADEARLDRASSHFERLWTNRHTDDHGLVADIFVGRGEARRVRLRDAPDEARHQVYKLN